jgi:hypothetical protein
MGNLQKKMGRGNYWSIGVMEYWSTGVLEYWKKITEDRR